MQLLEDGLIAALAAVGLVTLLYLPISGLWRLSAPGAPRAVAVVPCRGAESAGLEQTVRLLRRLRRDTCCFQRIVILDRGMDEETRQAAMLLCQDSIEITICNKESILDELE